MEPKKSQNAIGAGLAALGVVIAAAVGVFASTFNPPAQPVGSDTTTTVPIPTPTPIIPAPSPAAFGSIFPAPDTTTTTSTTTTSQPITVTPKKTVISTPTPTAVATNVYNDGTYSATGSYNSPGGQDQIAVTVTLSSDVVTAVSVVPKPGDRTSARYQTMFVSGYKQYVVGKDIASVHVGRVSGSSLTSIGFNAAIAKIESAAKA
ncbi:MAG: hypothetical protein JWM92_526 [Candidatus Nomurabacteria bacterium]|nr:hypothetical protein [Candidatus Nomurabacteria bacterium]